MAWHLLDHMQTTCTSLQTDNHTNTSSLINFLCSKDRKSMTSLILVADMPLQQLTLTHTHTRSSALFPGLPGWAGTRKVKPIWILLKQETVSGSGISWAICKSAHHSRQITKSTPHHSVFYRPDALPAAQPTASKH